MNTRLAVSKEDIAAFCQRWGIAELALFGSILREDFAPDSDVDVLVQFAPNARPSLFDMVRMEDELTGLFGRKVDLVSRRGIESSRNPIRRKAVLESTATIYAA